MEKTLPEFKDNVEEWQLVPSDGGRFEILTDGELVFSKLETGRFPEVDEIISLIQRKLRK
jgi:selenoprotein W-related protein